MHVAQADTQGNSNIGLYVHCTDSYAILGPEGENLRPLLEEVLQVPVIITTLAGTSLAGVFCTGYGDTVVVPRLAFDHEIEALENAGLRVKTIDTMHTALGNNIVCTPEGALAGPMFSDRELDALRKALDIPVHRMQIAGIEVVGSSVATNTTGCVVHPNATQVEMDLIVDTLGLSRIRPGTINFGNPYVRSGLIANDTGFLVGKTSGGPEITNADEAFGFVEG